MEVRHERQFMSTTKSKKLSLRSIVHELPSDFFETVVRRPNRFGIKSLLFFSRDDLYCSYPLKFCPH